MDPVTAVIFGVLLFIGIAAGPFVQVENRPAFKQPNVNPKPNVSSMRQRDWTR